MPHHIFQPSPEIGVIQGRAMIGGGGEQQAGQDTKKQECEFHIAILQWQAAQRNAYVTYTIMVKQPR